MPKRKPIRTLAEAERWCVKNHAELYLNHPCRDNGNKLCWLAIGDGHDAYAPTPWAAVEKLRKKVEGNK